MLYQPEKLTVPGRFALCQKRHGGTRVQQSLHDVSELESVVDRILRVKNRHKTHFWISQATLAPWAKNRQISSIMLLNAVWVDIDLAHPPKEFQGHLPWGHASLDAERMARLLIAQIEADGLPLPTYIIATGGGLCVKYLFETAVPTIARARWQSLQTHILKRFADLGDNGQRWPVDSQASDAARILRLVGTQNPRWDALCRIVWDGGPRYDFSMLADQILPYTQAQVAEFKARAREWKQWDANRLLSVKAGIRVGVRTPVEEQIGEEAARAMWTSRFEFGRAVLEGRGGAQKGTRNNNFWVMANALAYSCGNVGNLTQQLAALHHSHFQDDGWTRGEAMKSAASVMRRLEGGDLYKMKTSTFIDKLKAEGDLAQFGHLLGTSHHNRNRAAVNVGAMRFEPMKGLDAGAFIDETRRRQRQAGARSAEIRKTTYGPDLRKKAILMANSGLSLRAISQELDISVGTAHAWTRP